MKRADLLRISIRIAILLLLLPSVARAAVDLGLGLSSATAGRHVPALTGGIGGEKWMVSGSSTGARNAYYYYVNYSATFMRRWEAGDFFGGGMGAGFGGGAFYSQRSFKDEGATTQEQSDDFGLGPAFHVRWTPFAPVYLNLEVIWGLRNLGQHLALNGQDLVTFSIGVSL